MLPILHGEKYWPYRVEQELPDKILLFCAAFYRRFLNYQYSKILKSVKLQIWVSHRTKQELGLYLDRRLAPPS